MNNNTPNPNTDFEIERGLEELKDVPARNPLVAASARTRFLNEAAEYQQAVSDSTQVRQSWWKSPFRKEKLSMNALASLILAAFLLLGGSATIVAAQDDLPTQPLYQLKLWAENASLVMEGGPHERADLLMNMMQTRVQELSQLVERGVTPPDRVRELLQQHIDQAMRLAADMDEPARDQLLLQLRDQLQTQYRIMEKMQTHASTESELVLAQTRQMLQTRLQLVDHGLAEPQGFQYMLENQLRFGQEEASTPEPNQNGEPGFHQNDEGGKPAETPGGVNGPQIGSGESNSPSTGPNPDKPREGNGNGGSSDEMPGGPNPDSTQGGLDGQGGNGPGGDGGNK